MNELKHAVHFKPHILSTRRKLQRDVHDSAYRILRTTVLWPVSNAQRSVVGTVWQTAATLCGTGEVVDLAASTARQ